MSALKARLLPPSRAALPGGYDFARDAFFAGVGAVGSTLGGIELLPPPDDASLAPASFAPAIDHARNRLALRVDAIIGGDEGAIAAAMVTGKRDFLSNDAKDLIREAGIFHIITISGVQMTLVAGIFFVVDAAPAGAVADAGAELSDQEMGGRRRDGRLALLRHRHRLARRHRAGAGHDADRARRGHPRPAGADHAQSRLRGPRRRRDRARGDPRRQLSAVLRRGRGAGRGDGGAARGHGERPRSFPAAARPAPRRRTLVRRPHPQARSRSSSRPHARPARPRRSWPIISTTSAPMC